MVNVLFLFSDQQRPDTMGCYGQELKVSETLDALAEDGVLFTKAFTVQPLCGPARAALQLGQYGTQSGIFKNGLAIDPDRITMADVVRGNEGLFQTAYIGKWHLASSGSDTDETFYINKGVPPELRGGYVDYWAASDLLEITSHSYDGHMWDSDGNLLENSEGVYRADFVANYAIDFLQKRDKKRPFFCFVSFLEPHHQNDNKRYEGPHGSREMFADFKIPEDLIGPGSEDWPKGDWRENYPDYLGCCWSVDKNVNRIIEQLKQQGVFEDTLIIYTSDHGCHFRTRNGEYKRSCHESSIHIPLIIRGPGFTGGKKVDKLVTLLDLPPTIFAAVGAPHHAQFVGQPLQPLIESAKECKDVFAREDNWEDYVYVEISESHVGRAVRTNRFKFSIWVPPPNRARWSGFEISSSDKYWEECFYDLSNDPYEFNNILRSPSLLEHYSAEHEKLKEIIKNTIVKLGQSEPEILPYVDGWWSEPTPTTPQDNSSQSIFYNFCCFQ